jgi:hypothetical protein
MATDPKKRHDPTYAALASGPGSFKRAMEAALHRTPPSLPNLAVPVPAGARPAPDTIPQRVAPAHAALDGEVVTTPLPPPDASAAYRRALEELATFVVLPVAHRMLVECLEEEGCSPADAIPYDLRMVLVDALPRRLRSVLTADRVAEAVETLEQVLVTMHSPPEIVRKRLSSKELQAAPSTPPA